MNKNIICPPFRADLVGSFLRTKALKSAREEFSNGTITKEKLREVENKEIINLIDEQIKTGLEVVTDGEFRRTWWHLDFIEALDGIRVYEFDVNGAFGGVMTKAKSYTVNGKLAFPKNHPFIDDFKFLKDNAKSKVPKYTIPGPNMIYHTGIIASKFYKDETPYQNLKEAADDIVIVYQEAIAAFYDAGCRYLQLDDTSWGALNSEKFSNMLIQSGYNIEDVIESFTDITERAIANKPSDMVISIHICGGNFMSHWLYEGGYDKIASKIFTRVNVDAFFLEFDTDRAGDFSSLKYIKNQIVVLGLITTKTGDLEEEENIIKRIGEATQFLPLNQLALSPQCGFASTQEGNSISQEDQWKKMKLVKKIADLVWK